MWRSRVIAARRARSARTNAVRGLANSNSILNFSKIQSKVHYSETLASSHQSPSFYFSSIVLFQQINPIRLFSSDSTDSIGDSEVSNDDGNKVFDNENENESPDNVGEVWKEGFDEVKSSLEMDVSDSENGRLAKVVNDEVVNEETHEVDIEQLENVLSLLQGRDSDIDVTARSLESKLDDMNLNLNEEFVVTVLETELVPGENLISFFKWAINGKNQEVFTVTTRSLRALVRAICSKLKKKISYILWDLIKELGEKESGVVTTEMLNELISVFSKLGKGMAGYEVFSKFEDLLCVPDADSYYFAIEALCRRSIFDQVSSVCEKMLSEEKLPEAERIGNLICYLCKGGMVKEAHSVYLFAKEKERYPQSAVNILISSLCDMKKSDDDTVHMALKMLEDFSGEKQKYAIKQFSSVIQGLCRINDFEGAKSLLFKMIDAGPPPGNSVFNTVINAISKSGDMAEAIKIMRIMEGRGLKPDVFTYSVIMSGYAKGGEMKEAAKILTEAKKKHHKLTPVTYHTMIRGYCKIEQFDKAVKLLNEMEKYGVKPNVDEYNKLIQSLCLKAANWRIAEKLMGEMERKGLHLNGITKALVRAVKELEEEALETKEVSVEA